jgi:hypothetical protein
MNEFEKARQYEATKARRHAESQAACDELDKRCQLLLAEGKVETYESALRAVRITDPELWQKAMCGELDAEALNEYRQYCSGAER